MQVTICDKCGSDRVDRFAKVKPVETTIKMSELAKEPQVYTRNAMVRYTTMVLLCKDCGYRIEYEVMS